MPRDDAHLLDILKAARLAIEFKGPAEKAEFLEDAKTQSAVLHQLLIIGEAVKRMLISDLPELIRLIEPLRPDPC